MKHLELVRRHGFALDDQENDVEGRCVALAMPTPRVQVAISVSGITSRFPMSKANRRRTRNTTGRLRAFRTVAATDQTLLLMTSAVPPGRSTFGQY